MSFADFSSLLIVLKIPFVKALYNAALSVKNPYYSGLFVKIAKKSSSIEEFKEQVNKINIFPVMLIKSFEFSKTPEDIGKTMGELSEYYRRNFDKNHDRIVKMIEPFILVFLGVIIGGLVIAMYLPIFTMAGAIG